MKKIILSLSLLTVAFSALLSGCVKDKCSNTRSYTFFTPVYKTKDEVRNNIKSNAPKNIETPGKFFVLGNYIFLNEINKGVHIIDNSNPSNPVNKAFIDIPGNVDIAVKGNTLYADLYTDLVAIDISNPQQVTKTKIIDNVFPERSYFGFSADTNKLIFEWVKHDTTVTEDCTYNFGGWLKDANVGIMMSLGTGGGGSGSGVPTGIAGSLSRFALLNSYLYAISNSSSIKVVDIATVQNPNVVNTVVLNSWRLETLYPFQNKLFVGASDGMYILNVQNPVSPTPAGSFTHARVCDPVIADNDYAYVTLRNGTSCTGFLNELNVVNVTNINAPFLVKRYNLINPRGLSKDGNLLFICDGQDGLKVFDATNVQNITLLKNIAMSETFDVITWNGRAMVVAKDGLYQFDYTNINNIRQLSKISVNP